MPNYHQTTIIGHLGQDPETRYMPSGDAVCNLSVAVTESWTKDGEKKEKTTWYRVATFKKLAEICGQYLKKGAPVMFVGKMDCSEYEKDGKKQYSWQLIADTMQMLGSRSDGDSRPTPAPKNAAPSSQPAGNFGDFEDDIPF